MAHLLQGHFPVLLHNSTTISIKSCELIKTAWRHLACEKETRTLSGQPYLPALMQHTDAAISMARPLYAPGNYFSMRKWAIFLQNASYPACLITGPSFKRLWKSRRSFCLILRFLARTDMISVLQYRYVQHMLYQFRYNICPLLVLYIIETFNALHDCGQIQF